MAAINELGTFDEPGVTATTGRASRRPALHAASPAPRAARAMQRLPAVPESRATASARAGRVVLVGWGAVSAGGTRISGSKDARGAFEFDSVGAAIPGGKEDESGGRKIGGTGSGGLVVGGGVDVVGGTVVGGTVVGGSVVGGSVVGGSVVGGSVVGGSVVGGSVVGGSVVGGSVVVTT